MRILDTTEGITLADDASEATSYWARFRGLMLRPPLGEGEALIIRPCSSIQMTFMRFRIDAVFFDHDLHVTRVALGVRPWIGFSMGGKGAWGVIELPNGAAEGVETGDELEFLDE